MTTQATTTFSVDAMRRAVESADLDAFLDMFTEDVEWTEIDQRTPPAAPARLRGREPIGEQVRAIVDRGITATIEDGFVAGDHGAVRLTCTYPSGGRVVEHALFELRDGRIARWSAVQAWDE
jgi:ketosteroid isomerase-like protein